VTVDGAHPGGVVEDACASDDHDEPRRVDAIAEEDGLEACGEHSRLGGIELAHPVLLPERGGHLDSAELGDGDGFQRADRFGTVLVGVELHERGGVRERTHRCFETISERLVLRPARARALTA
jgi:hypothetical protein